MIATPFLESGELDLEVNDATLVVDSPASSYVLVVLTDNLGSESAWHLIAQISAAVSKYEQAR